MRITQKRIKPSPVVIAALIAFLVLGGYFVYAYTTKSAWPFKQATQTSSASSDGINYSPPTKQEAESSQDAKKDAYDDDNKVTPQQESNKRTVSVGIAFADYDPEEDAIDVRAFTPDVIEGDGTCTATFTKTGSTVTESSKAFVDFSSSQCQPILIPKSRFSAGGTWKLTVSYDSSKSSGVSPAMDIEINQ